MRGGRELAHARFDGKRHVGIARVVEIVAAAFRIVIHVDLIGLEPVRRPKIRNRIEQREPNAVVLKFRITADVNQRQAIDEEWMARPKIGAESSLWYAVAAITAAFAPVAMFPLPVIDAMLLENIAFIASIYATSCLQPVSARSRAPLCLISGSFVGAAFVGPHFIGATFVVARAGLSVLTRLLLR